MSGLVVLPKEANAVVVLAHGAGAGMRHRFMEETAQKLADHGIATFRYQFAYMEKGSKRPDSEAVLTASVRAAVTTAKKHADGLPLFAGGKSMGGRMTSLAAAKEPLEGVRGLIYFGFPLHAAGKPSVNRGEHLFERQTANAIPAGISGCAGRSQTLETALRSSRQTRRAFYHRWR